MSSHNRTQEAVQTDDSAEGLGMEEHLTHCQEMCDGPRGLCQATIDDLSDDALLEIFDLYLDDKNSNDIYSADQWHTLVHVCGRWRGLVFASPRRLDLRLLCTAGRSASVMLDIWPALLIQIEYDHDWGRTSEMAPNNNVAALGHPDRVRHISITGFPRAWNALAAAMHVPFPELTYLQLSTHGSSPSFLPGGSAPRLRTLKLKDIPFLAARDLIMSAGDLVDLTLLRSGYVLPESMVTCLSSLKRLESLWLEFGWFEFRPDRPTPPPQARAVFPALAKLAFNGRSVYLGDFVARIGTPVLTRLDLSLHSDLIFDIPHLKQFIGRARGLKPPKAARVSFYSWLIRLESLSCDSGSGIVWDCIDLDPSSIALVCGQLSPFLSLVERLDLVMTRSPFVLGSQVVIEAALFHELFRPFTSIQGLYVYENLVPFIARALQELIGERATEVLPHLRDLFLGGSVIPGSVQEAIKPFVDARRLSGRPITIHCWKKEKADG
ncbi:hypothetical protein BC826DRAFT_117995 [Russula brevipes]|nr:hypothetical protein BC826DRAFT_117995 [Russula brevipes]